MSDLISRKAVKEILRTEWVKLFPMELDPYLSIAMKSIDELPSAEPNENIPDDLDEYLDECKEKWWHRWRTK